METASTPDTKSTTPPVPTEPVPVKTHEEKGILHAAPTAVVPAKSSRGETIKTLIILLIALGVLGVVFAMSLGWEIPGLTTRQNADAKTDANAPLRVELVRDEHDPKRLTHTLMVPEEVRKTLRIWQNGKDIFATATLPTTNQTLELPGSTALNPARIARIRVRFPTNGTEVVSIARQLPPSSHRELQPGDIVKAGQPLATFYSVDVGSKKNDLIDAICQLKLDQQIYDKAIAAPGAVPEVFILNALRAVAGDVNAVNRAVKMLETWNVPAEDIQAVRDEAEEISKLMKPGQGLRPPTNPDRERLWGMVTLKSPIDGVIIERNITEKEIVVDNTINVFQIANVSDLVVLANAPEDQLPRLKELHEKGLTWTVRTAGAPPKTGLVGAVSEIGYIIDPNMHTAILKGFIKNDKGTMRGGQYVTATIELPREENVVEIPMAAIADDGRQSIVFVQPDPTKPVYTMRRVQVTHRFDKVAYVRSVLTEEEKAAGTKQAQEQGVLPLSTLQVGEHVITSGLLELKKELDDRESTIAASKAP
jgi:cobalt-zinc-cadmium efflux system membrane fusion protein